MIINIAYGTNSTSVSDMWYNLINTHVACN